MTAASASRSNFSGVHRWLELCGACRHFVPSRTRSKAPNLRGEQSRVMCMYQEFAQEHKTSSRDPVSCDSPRSGTHPSLCGRLTYHGHLHAQLDHILNAHAPPFAMRHAFSFAVFHSFSVELRLDAGLSGVDRPRACPLATSVPSWTSHQTTVMVIGQCRKRHAIFTRTTRTTRENRDNSAENGRI